MGRPGQHRPARYYTLTAAGRKHLRAQARELGLLDRGGRLAPMLQAFRVSVVGGIGTGPRLSVTGVGRREKTAPRVTAVSAAAVVPLSLQVYCPVGPQIGAITIHARSEGDAGAGARALHGVLADVDPRVRVRVRPLQDVMAVALFPAQVAATCLRHSAWPNSATCRV